MLIAQISDPHITPLGKKAYGIAPTAKNLTRVIDHINQLNPKADLVLITGDITNNFTLEGAEHAAFLLSKLNCPYYIIPGNHDDRKNLNSVFGDKICPLTNDGFINHVIDEYDISLIGLDSLKLGEPGGELCKNRLDWLEMALAKQSEKPVVIFMHHPPIKCSVLETDIDGFDGAEEFGDIVEKYANIEAIICGHIHLPTHSRWRGTIVSTAPSTGMQLGLDLTMKRPSEFYLNASGYLLHHYTKEKNIITHTIYVRKKDNGPYPFEEHR
jgi:3',5'-cyclic AMP phosphodiesterase CpdA